VILRRLILVFSIIFLPIAVLIGFIGTERGTRITWDLLHHAFPDQFTASRIEGRLFDSIRIHDLRIHTETTEITIKRFDLVWQPALLFHGQLVIEEIRIDELIIDDHSSPSPASHEPLKLPDLQLPFTIEVQRFLITDSSYRSGRAPNPILIERLQSSLAMDGKTLHLSKTQMEIALSGTRIKGGLSGTIQPSMDYPLDFIIDWEIHPADLPTLTGRGKIHGDRKRLWLEQSGQTPFSFDLKAGIEQPLESSRWTAEIKLHELDLSTIEPNHLPVRVRSQLQAKGDRQTASLSGDFQLDSDAYGLWKGRLLLDHQFPDNIHLKTMQLRSARNGALLDLTGTLQLAALPHMDLHGRWQALTWPVNDEPALALDKGEISLTGTPDNYQLQMETELQNQEIGKSRLTLQGSGDTKHLVIEKLKSHLLSGVVEARSTVEWRSTPVTFDLDGHWKDLNFPLQKTNILSPSGHFSLSGQPEHYDVHIKTRIEGHPIPSGDWGLDATGSTSGMDLTSLQGEVLDGKIDLSGTIHWDEKVRWDLKLNGRHLDPAQQYTEWPGELAIESSFSGEKAGDQFHARLKKTHIRGHMRGYSVEANADLDFTPDLLTVKVFDLKSGRSVFRLSGRIGENFGLQFKLDSPNLGEFHPDLKGRLESTGRLSGRHEQPELTATIQGSQLTLDNIRIHKLDSHLKLNLATNAPDQGDFNLLLKAEKVVLDHTPVDTLLLTSNGTPGNHSFTVEMDSQQAKLRLFSTGGYQDAQWTGHVEKLLLDEKNLGQWQLSKPARLLASPKFIRFNALCLIQNQASICNEGEWDQSGPWELKGKVTGFPLRKIAPMLDPELSMQGTLNASLKVSGTGHTPIRGNLKMKSAGGELHWRSQPDSIPFRYDNATLDLVMDDRGGHTTLRIDLAEPANTPITATLETPPFDPASVNPYQLPIEGSLKARIEDLAFLQDFAPEVEDLTGQVDVDMQLTGTLSQPIVSGHGHLQADFFLPAAGIHVQAVRISLQGKETGTLNFKGEAHSGDGTIDLAGLVDLRQTGFPFKATLRGDRFETIHLPEAWVLASPKLELERIDNRITLKGEVAIPEARLEPLDIAGAVPVSNDVVVIDSESQNRQKDHPGLQIESSVDVILGRKVTIVAPTFSGSLKGGLKVRSKPGKPIIASGELILHKGKFSAYGQELTVKQGRILFTGGPIDSPALDIRAVRKIGKITAGVHVTGPADSPILTLFSKPPMNQDDILSYLLIGRPLREATSNDADILITAASSLGFKGGELLTQNIGQALGLDELSISGKKKEDARLEIGKYLTPKLYISYGVALFDTVTQFKLRYDLSDHWTLEAESGTQSGVDLLYKFEK